MTRKLALSAALGLALAAGAAHAQTFRFMTGPQGGSWYPLGGAIQGIVEKAIPGSSVQVAPGAGISNVRGIQEGKAEFGFGNGVSSVDGVAGREPFKVKHDNVCQSRRSTSSTSTWSP
jgi:hypothetical protein